MNLRMAAFDAGDFTDAAIQVAKRAGIEIYVDRHWQDAIDRGATGIQTDHPAELVEYLRSRSLHK
jgi:glycerophosphoryl diester phosphodiesterase